MTLKKKATWELGSWTDIGMKGSSIPGVRNLLKRVLSKALTLLVYKMTIIIPS